MTNSEALPRHCTAERRDDFQWGASCPRATELVEVALGLLRGLVRSAEQREGGFCRVGFDGRTRPLMLAIGSDGESPAGVGAWSTIRDDAAHRELTEGRRSLPQTTAALRCCALMAGKLSESPTSEDLQEPTHDKQYKQQPANNDECPSEFSGIHFGRSWSRFANGCNGLISLSCVRRTRQSSYAAAITRSGSGFSLRGSAAFCS